MSTLPKLRDDLKEFEVAAGISVDVLVLIESTSRPVTGRYLHGIGEWQVDYTSGYPTVIEWWPLPEIGTGQSMVDADDAGGLLCQKCYKHQATMQDDEGEYLCSACYIEEYDK